MVDHETMVRMRILMWLVLAVLAIGIGTDLNTYLNKGDDEGTSNPDGLTKEDKCLIGLLGFLWLTGFAICIGLYLSKTLSKRCVTQSGKIGVYLSKSGNPSGLTKEEKCVLGVGFLALAVFTIGIYLNKEEEGGVIG